MYGCETWTIKKKRIEANKLLCWRRLLRGPWTTRRSNQSILKEINPEYSLEGLSWSSNTLATWCKELVHRKRFWCWERLRAEGEAGDRGQDGWMASLTQWTWVIEKAEEQEIKQVNPKGNQPRIFIGRTEAEAEAPVLCEKLIHWKISWCWERSRAGKGDKIGRASCRERV